MEKRGASNVAGDRLLRSAISSPKNSCSEGSALNTPDNPDDSNLRALMAPEELRRAMATLGYRTQRDLADAIGVSRSAVSLWLEGKVGVPRPVAMLLRMLIAARRRAY